MLRSRFFWQLFGGYVVVVLVTAFVLWASLGRWVQDESLLSIEKELRADAALFAPLAVPVLVDGELDGFPELVVEMGEESGLRLTVLRANGDVVADSHGSPATMDNHADRPEVIRARADGTALEERYSETVDRRMYYVARALNVEGELVGFVRTSLPSSEVDVRLEELRELVSIGAIVASLAALGVGFLVVRWVRSPIASMTSLAESMAGGEYARRVPVRYGDEIGQLASAFNLMAEHVENRMDTITKDRNLLQAIFTSMVEGVVAVDREERVVHMNAIARRILGVRSSDVLGRRFWEIARVDEIAMALAASLEGESAPPSQSRIVHDGGEHLVEINASPLRDAADELVGAVVVIHDVTDVRRLELVRSEFVVNASHELKTPIAAIHGILETVASDPEMPDATRTDFLRRAAAQGVRLSSLVTDLIQLSRLESDTGRDEFVRLDLREVVRQSINGLQGIASAKDIVLRAARGRDPITVLGDRATISLIVDNLVDNAIKYTPTGGHVDVRILTDDAFALIEVTDDGVGIEPKHLDRIFERFYRVDKARSRQLGGTGLGLAIVKHAVGVLSGQLAVESEPGSGSTFRVRLPLAVLSAGDETP